MINCVEHHYLETLAKLHCQYLGGCELLNINMDDNIKKKKMPIQIVLRLWEKKMTSKSNTMQSILVQLWKFFSHTQNTVGIVIILLCLKFLAILSEFFASCIKSVDKKIKADM